MHYYYHQRKFARVWFRSYTTLYSNHLSATPWCVVNCINNIKVPVAIRTLLWLCQQIQWPWLLFQGHRAQILKSLIGLWAYFVVVKTKVVYLPDYIHNERDSLHKKPGYSDSLVTIKVTADFDILHWNTMCPAWIMFMMVLLVQWQLAVQLQ